MDDNEIHKSYNIIKRYWKKHLKKHGVKLPDLYDQSGNYTKNALVLVLLSKGYPKNKPVSKTDLTKFIRKYFPNTNDVQQARHLGRQYGWYIVSSSRHNHVDIQRQRGIEIPNNSYYLVSLEKPYPNWKPRLKSLNEEEWSQIKAMYNFRCATCGSKEGEPNLLNPNRITILQQSHLDPNDHRKGIIPQCEECNQAYRDWFVFDSRGRIIKVASYEPVVRASMSVRKKIYKRLYIMFGGQDPTKWQV